MKVILQPFSDERLGDLLKATLNGKNGAFHSFQAAIAFVKKSGVHHISTELKSFISEGNSVRIIVGIDQYVTSYDGLKYLLEAVGSLGEIWINHTKGIMPVTFHPKLYLFEGEQTALLIIGSGNLTSGGLYTNDEAFSVNLLDLQQAGDKQVLDEAKQALAKWSDTTLENVKQLDENLLRLLTDRGYIRTEEFSRTETEDEASKSFIKQEQPDEPASTPLFGKGHNRRRPPKLLPSVSEVIDEDEEVPQPVVVQKLDESNWFAITVLDGDLPQRGSSYEIRIGKAVRDIAPQFWGWDKKDTLYDYDEEKGQYTRKIVIRFEGQILRNSSLKDYPSKKPDGTKASADFRLSSVAQIVQRLVEEEDMIVLELADDNDIDYIAHVIHKTDNEYDYLANGLIQHTRSKSTKTGTFKKYKYTLID
jgi:HKD family nuclease